MAEALAGLAVASSIIAVLQLTGVIITQGYSYIGGLKDVPKELKELVQEASSLNGILSVLKGQLDDARAAQNNPRLLALELLNKPGGTLDSCKEILKNVQETLDSIEASRMGSYLVGLMKAKDIRQQIWRLERLKSVLQLALYTDQMTLSKAVEGYLQITHEEFRKGQQVIGKRIQDIDYSVKKLYNESKRRNLGEEVILKDRERDEILQWLSKVNHTSNHHTACALQQPGTGKWLTEGKDFKQWQNTPASLLWLHGIPGSGKTILMSTIIKNITSLYGGSSDTVVIYFYFDFKDSEKQKTAGMLGSLLSQLLRRLSTIPDEVKSLFEKHEHKQCATVYELQELLRTVLRYFTRSFIILDALDECTERPTLLSTLDRFIGTGNLRGTNFLFASRKEHDIEAVFSKHPIHSIFIQNDQVAADVKVHVTKSIEDDELLRKLNVKLKDHIISTLAQQAKGMFRWVQCQLDTIRELKRPKVIREALELLPQGLDETYERILLGIKSDDDKELMRRALQFIIFSARPMSLEEVAEAVVIEEGVEFLDQDARLNNPELLLTICGSLLKLTGRQLGLAHYSVQEYLKSERIRQGPASQFSVTETKAAIEISKICLTYLGFNDFGTGPCDNINTRQQSFPLIEYAANNWFKHVQASSEEDSIIGFATKILTAEKTPKYMSWLQAYNYGFFNPSGDTENSLYYSALFGLPKICQYLLNAGSNTDSQGRYWLTPLHGAARGGYEGVIIILLQHGAEINAKNHVQETALHYAVTGRSKRIVEVLLQHGADANIENYFQETALHLAVRGGYDEIVEILLLHGVDINAQDRYWKTALHYVAKSGSEKVVEILLQHGADINSQDFLQGTALHHAAREGHEKIVEILLEHGADINVQDYYQETALQLAVMEGHKGVVGIFQRIVSTGFSLTGERSL